MAKRRGNRTRSRLEQHRKDGQAIEIRRAPLNPYSTVAFVIALGNDLVLLHVVTDFDPDGFQIVRIEDITSIEYRGFEKFHERVLRAEGLINDIRPPFKMDLSDWKSAIGAIKDHSRIVIIEDEDPDDELFLIGKAKRLNSQTLSIRQFDAAGRWELNDRIVPYSRISAVTFDDRYSNLYGKYVRDPE